MLYQESDHQCHQSDKISIVSQLLCYCLLRRVFREALYGDGDVYYCDRKPNFEYDVTIDVNLLKKQIDEKEASLRELTSEIQKLDFTKEI